MLNPSLCARARRPGALRLFAADSRLATTATPESLAMVTAWTVTGWPMQILTWSADVWAGMPVKPTDAEPNADGSWVALRVA